MRSIRRWSYEMFRQEHAIKFVAMVTPEDMQANAGSVFFVGFYLIENLISNSFQNTFDMQIIMLMFKAVHRIWIIPIANLYLILLSDFQLKFIWFDYWIWWIILSFFLSRTAVWAGWGHASENPKLPELLHQNGIAFIGISILIYIIWLNYFFYKSRSTWTSYVGIR